MDDGWPADRGLLELPTKLDDAARAHLAAEFEHLGSSLLANEESGERRLSVFLGFVAATVAGLGLAASALQEDIATLSGVAVLVLMLLLLFGLITARRIMERNLATTELLNALRLIRAGHAVRNIDVVTQLPFIPGRQGIRRSQGFFLGKGGFLETAAVVNSAIGASALGLSVILLGYDVLAAVLVAGLGALLAWFFQIAWARRVYAAGSRERGRNRSDAIAFWRASRPRSSEAPSSGETFRAGVGLLVEGPGRKILALERSDVPEAWQLPQGGIEAGEDVVAAGWRELHEEVGLTSQHVELSARLDVWVGYELPDEYRSPKTGRGQVHTWLLFRLRDGIELPALPTEDDAEFRRARWMDMADIVSGAVAFRQSQYRFVHDWFDGLRRPSSSK